MTRQEIQIIFVIVIIGISSIQTRTVYPYSTFKQSYHPWEQRQNTDTSSFRRIHKSFPPNGQNIFLGGIERLGRFIADRTWYRRCDKDALLVPLPAHRLKFPYFELLPNDEVRVKRSRLSNACMPEKPILSDLKLDDGEVCSLFLSSNFLSNNNITKLSK